jgi:hypothetical protein
LKCGRGNGQPNRTYRENKENKNQLYRECTKEISKESRKEEIKKNNLRRQHEEVKNFADRWSFN